MTTIKTKEQMNALFELYAEQFTDYMYHILDGFEITPDTAELFRHKIVENFKEDLDQMTMYWLRVMIYDTEDGGKKLVATLEDIYD